MCVRGRGTDHVEPCWDTVGTFALSEQEIHWKVLLYILI